MGVIVCLFVICGGGKGDGEGMGRTVSMYSPLGALGGIFW